MNFILLSQQGSGTRMVRSLLNSHPDIYCWNEMFIDGHTELKGVYWDYDSLYADEYMDILYQVEKKAVGIDIKYNQLFDPILKYIKEQDIKVIQLMRSQKYIAKGDKDYENTIGDFYKKYKEIVDYKIHYNEITGGKRITKTNKLNDLQKYLGVKPRTLCVS